MAKPTTPLLNSLRMNTANIAENTTTVLPSSSRRMASHLVGVGRNRIRGGVKVAVGWDRGGERGGATSARSHSEQRGWGGLEEEKTFSKNNSKYR